MRIATAKTLTTLQYEWPVLDALVTVMRPFPLKTCISGAVVLAAVLVAVPYLRT